MASFAAIQSVGKSIERLLLACFKDEDPVGGPKKTKAFLIRTEDFEKPRKFGVPALTIFLYRVEVNRTLRPGWSGIGYIDGKGHLPLDLHFLLTAWGDNPEDEFKILGKTMQCLEQTPVLSGPLLHEPADWAPNDVLQVVTGDLSNDALMRIFDSLQADYKLSVPYIARTVRIDTRTTLIATPVTTTVVGTVPSTDEEP